MKCCDNFEPPCPEGRIKRILILFLNLVFSFSVYERPRFLEIISVSDAGKAIDLIENLPTRKCYEGIEKVQTSLIY